MAAATPRRIFEKQNNNNNNNRQEIEAAIAKAVELRALHAALLQGNNTPASSLRSPFPYHHHHHHVSNSSAQDYPVFTPSYEDEPLPGYFPGNWDEYNLGGNVETPSSWTDLRSQSHNLDLHICPVDDQKSVTGSCTNHNAVHKASPGTTDFTRSRRNSLGDFKSLSSCNKCKPAIISTEAENPSKNFNYSNIVVPLTDSHSSIQTHHKSRGLNFSCLFQKLKKRHNKSENYPNMVESDQTSSQMFKDFSGFSIESLKRDLIKANESRDAALVDASQMKSSLGELKMKLDYLESYCEELKKALKQAVQTKSHENIGKIPLSGKSIEGTGENVLPVTTEVMIEGFLQIVSEARLSVKQLCKTLIGQVEEKDNTLMDNLNFILLPYKLSLNSKYSKAVLYHLEAIINQALYQDFENCIFQKNGTPKFLDPQEDRQAHFASFVALRKLSWNEVLRKGTKYYSEEFSKFCDQKMSGIIATLNWNRPWPEQLLQAFFVAAKCIWLVHLLAFSFNPSVGILRVKENRSFDGHFMEDLFIDRQRSSGPSRVKVMVVPGFYVQGRVLRCKVLCRYKPIV